MKKLGKFSIGLGDRFGHQGAAELNAIMAASKKGAEITYLGVNADGIISLTELEAAIRPNTILLSIMYANNETGTIQPINEIGAIAKKHGVLFFTDATQAVGKIHVDVIKDGIDMLALSAHKFYGPKGTGAIYLRRKNPRVKLAAQLDGGGHERGVRSGTLNVPGIVGLGKAAELAQQEMKSEAKRVTVLRNKLEEAFLRLGGTLVNGSSVHRLPHVSNISFGELEGQSLMMSFNKDIAVSSGSACTSASMEPSYVLKAHGLSDVLAHSSIRFSVGRFTTEEEIDYAIEKVTKAVMKKRDLIKSILK